jgi:hypothetical protein
MDFSNQWFREWNWASPGWFYSINWFQIESYGWWSASTALRSFRDGSVALGESSLGFSCEERWEGYSNSTSRCLIICGMLKWCFIIFWWWLRHWSGDRVRIAWLIWTFILIFFLAILSESKSYPLYTRN